jgi:hypothetical protein
MGIGKGWSKGLTAAVDPRIARNAAAHRGMVYQRRTPVERDRRLSAGPRRLPLEWSPVMAYVVGLIATDGCLVNDRRHVSFTTTDRELAETFLRCMGRPLRFGKTRTSVGNVAYRVQVGDVALYRWLESVGLTQRKSLTLGPIDVPDAVFSHLVRGLLDGDGTISNFVHAPTRRSYPGYRYERLHVRFCSASVAHITWLRERIAVHLEATGTLVTTGPRAGRHEFFSLTYGKRDSIGLLKWVYADAGSPRLDRKWRIWDSYRSRNLSSVQ